MDEKGVDSVVKDILSDFGGSVPDVICVFGGKDEDREFFMKGLSSRVSSEIIERGERANGVYSLDLGYLNSVYN